MKKRSVWIQLSALACAFLIGSLASSMTAAEAAPARTCQWTYLVDDNEPEIAGFPPHDSVTAPSTTGRGNTVKSNDAELKRRWEHLGKTGWQLKTVSFGHSGIAFDHTVYVFEYCQ